MQYIFLPVLLLYYSTVVVLYQEIRQPTSKVKVEKMDVNHLWLKQLSLQMKRIIQT